jgi:two-component system sensor histidine kinase YesM
MRNWMKKSLKRKLTIMLIVAFLLPLLSFGYFSYQTASNITEEKTKQSGMNILGQVQTNLEFIVQDIENMSVFIIGRKNIQEYLNNGADDITKLTDVSGFLLDLAESKSYISNITIEPINPLISSVSTLTISHSDLPDITKQEPHYFEEHAKWWSPLYEIQTNSGAENVISLVRPIRSTGKFKKLGMMTISIREDAINGILKQSGISGSGFVVLLQPDNRIISGGEPAWLNKGVDEIFPGIGKIPSGKGFYDYGTGKMKKTILYDNVSKVDWKLLGFVPFKEYTSDNRYVLSLTGIAVGIALLLVIGLVLFFVQWVTQPLLALTHFLKDANPDEPIPTYHVKSMDEVGQLVKSYNKLSRRIESLTEQVKLKETRKKEADMQALQAQINPHFLYNTLSSIHWMALMNKDNKISNMVGALSEFLRFSLNKGGEICSVEQEVSHARNYADIQAIRFPDQFELFFYIDPKLHSCSMLKLVLQPLIENALMHGIQKKTGRGVIQIYGGFDAKSMRFIVEDDGVGMEPQLLASIRQQLAESLEENQAITANYGLKNVHRRLILHYGEASGLSIESIEGKGTTIKFSIPIAEAFVS